ncbi:hypothetical protein [Oryza sativa Japonica Group]|uniref:Uncharacterized protein n=1 Tax=Oryza sativa subsp. japonica TaxID=39947 RepID=Q5N9A9_ORYSJ|nr:hypothetical protein [Oryza sativa Japonica Group]
MKKKSINIADEDILHYYLLAKTQKSGGNRVSLEIGPFPGWVCIRTVGVRATLSYWASADPT